MKKENSPIPEEAVPFLSFTSLRDTYRELVVQRRDETKDDQPESEEFWTAVYDFLARGEAAGAYLDKEDDRESAQTMLDYWHNKLFHAGKEAPDGFLADFNPNLQPEIPDDRCPYIGLEAFSEGNYHLFYGRSELIEQLLQHVTVNRLIATVGSSGSGKSSVIRAGLLPKLKEGAVPGSRSWHYLPPIVPGSAPLIQLINLLRDESHDELWLLDNIDTMRESGQRLTELIDQQFNAPTVLIIDQFEETFTLCHDETERKAFLDNLLHFVNSRTHRHLLILTMRVDYESYLNKEPLFQALFEQGEVRVAAMNAGELREAIEKPADSVGLKFEEGLVDALIRDIVGEPAVLPLLQFTLLQLWDNRERNRVTWQTYRRLGGVMKALANTADEIYDGLIPEDQVTARRILLRIVQPSSGLEFTRRRIPRRMLYQSGEAKDRIDRVLDRLIQARLVRLTKGATDADDQIEVAHEALIRNWPRLGEWLEETAVSIRQRQRLTTQAEHWDQNGRESDTLLRGNVLREATGYDDLTPIETEYIKASQVEKERVKQEKIAAQERELAQARALVSEQMRVAKAERERADARKRQAIAQQERGDALELASRRTKLFNSALIATLIFAIGAIFLFVRANGAQQEIINAQETAEAESALSLAALADAATAVSAQKTAEYGQGEAEEDAIQAQEDANESANEIATLNAEESFNQTAEAAAVQTRGGVQATGTANAFATLDALPTQTPLPTGEYKPTATPPLSQSDLISTRVVEYNSAALREAIRRESDGMTMVFISEGSLQLGSSRAEVALSSFYIDQYEVTVFQYAAFLNNRKDGSTDCGEGNSCNFSRVQTIYSSLQQSRDGSYAAIDGYGSTPINQVSWYGAQAYCETMDARLPTEAEWEYAAKGLDGRLFPWGDSDPDSNKAVYNIRANFSNDIFNPMLDVGALPNGVSPFNVYGMAGGAWEWVQDWYSDGYETLSDSGSANTNNASGLRVVRGGSWQNSANEVTTNSRVGLKPELGSPTEYWSIGFRCARDGN